MSLFKRREKPKDKVFNVGYKCLNCGATNWLRRTQKYGSMPIEMLPMRHECPELVGQDKPFGIAYAFSILEITE